MVDVWSRSLALLAQATAVSADRPPRRVKRLGLERPTPRPPKTAPSPRTRQETDPTDLAVLAALQFGGLAALDLAGLLGTTRRAMGQRLLRLHEQGMVRCNRVGIWEIFQTGRNTHLHQGLVRSSAAT